MRQVYIEDCEVKIDIRSFNPAREQPGCTSCFNLQSYYKQRGRRCMKHGGVNEFGEHPLLMEMTYGA